MASLNKVQLIGNLGADPEIRVFPNGSKIATVRVATNDRWKDRQTGELKEHAEWHNLVFAGTVVQTVEVHLRKGMRVYVEGRLRTRKWQDKQGEDRYTTEVIARTFQFLDAKPDSDGVPPGYDAQDDDISM